MTLYPSNAKARTVTLAVLTYQRNDDLVRAVESMVACAGAPEERFWTLTEILVIDNNPDGSARSAVEALDSAHEVTVRYVHETTPGIVAARNRALSEAAGQILIFIDDDEVALPGWPTGLLEVMEDADAALVGGPVVTEFLEEPPQWALDSGFFDQDDDPDGATRTWLSTCNLAIDLDKINQQNLRFDVRYPHGEDAAFSRTAASRGLKLRWSATATVKEYVSPERTTVKWRRHRQRISTDAWVRVDLDLDPSLKAKLLIVGKSATRLLQAIGILGAGIVPRDRERFYASLILFSHVRGSIDGLIAHQREHPRGSDPGVQR